MTIRRYRAKGPFVNLLFAGDRFWTTTRWPDRLQRLYRRGERAADRPYTVCRRGAAPAVESGGGGVGAAWPCCCVGLPGRGIPRHTLVLVNAVLLFLSGLCSTLGISPLLACMALGAGYVNLGGEKRLFKRMDKFSPPFLLLFFALSGLRLNIRPSQRRALSAWPISSYASQGKYAGPAAVRALCRADPSIIKYLGLALTPQAGVSIGLAVLGQRMLPAAEGTMLATIILSSAVLYELTGPACAKLALCSGAIPTLQPGSPPAGMGGCRACRIRATRRNRLARRDKNAAPPQKKTQNPFVIRFLLLYSRRVIKTFAGLRAVLRGWKGAVCIGEFCIYPDRPDGPAHASRRYDGKAAGRNALFRRHPMRHTQCGREEHS